MVLDQKNLKTILSCRVDPLIKEEIIEEAITQRMTTSNYIETILRNRQEEEPIDMELENDITIHELNEEMELLKHELEEMTNQRDDLLEGQLEDDETQKKFYQLERKISLLKKENNQLESQKQNAEHHYFQTKEELKVITQGSIQFDENEIAAIDSVVNRLAKDYPNASLQKIIIASLSTSLKNENSLLFIHTLKSQLK